MPLGRAFHLGLLLAAASCGQQYPFLPVAGSPRNIEHMLRDRQGRVWMSTHDDVVCFDGSRFYSLKTLGFPPQGAWTLADDGAGGIVIGSIIGVHRYSGGRVERLTDKVEVSDLVSVAPNVLLAAGKRGQGDPWHSLYRIQLVAGKWLTEELSGPPVALLTKDLSGSILTACPGGWCEFTSQAILETTPAKPLLPLFHSLKWDFQRVHRDRFGCLWFRSVETGAYQCPGDLRPVPLPAFVAGRNVWSSETELEDGSMLFGNVASVAMGRPGSFEVAKPEDGLPLETVSSVLRCPDGTILVASIGGLFRFPYPFRMRYWKSRHGLVWSIARSRSGILAGTSAGIASLDENGRWTILPDSRNFGSVSSLLPEPGGGLYAALARQAVIHLGPGGTLLSRTRPGEDGQADVLARTSDGNVWMAGSGFFRVRERGRDLNLTPQNPPGIPPQNAIVTTDAAGALWSCFAGNVLRHDGHAWIGVARAGLPNVQCRSLLVDSRRNTIWAGFVPGLFLMRLNRERAPLIRGFHVEIGNSNTFAMTVDGRGWLWRGSQDGVHVATPSQAEAGNWLHIDRFDGLPDLDVNHGSLFADRDESLWWAAGTNIIHFRPPAHLLESRTPAPVYLSGFSVAEAADRPVEVRDPFAYGKKVVAHLGSLQFAARNGIVVRYRVLPENSDWRETSALDVNLGTERIGAHTLEIQSRMPTSAWSPVTSYAYQIARPWWLAWQALVALVTVLLGALTGLIGLHRRRKRRARQSLPDLNAWRLAALSPEAELVGAVLDNRFAVSSLLAHGGFASILLGRDLAQEGCPCAIKVFRRDVLDEEWLTHRFHQEVAALNRIGHRSVVRIYGHGITPSGVPYLAMEFVEGKTLRVLLEEGPLSPQHAASLLKQTATALHHIHASGIYHRDIKPENLMLRAGAPEGEELVLIDFSIAIVKEPDRTMHGLSRAAGTLYYMAPEQAVGFATPASDIYSLTRVIVEMLTGQRLSTLLPNASMDMPKRVQELAESFPIRLSAESLALLGAALEFDPLRRPQNAWEFARPLVRDLSAGAFDPSASPGPFPTDDEPAEP